MTINAIPVFFRAPSTREWCAQVTDAPELNNKMVFNKGICQGFSVVKNTGGHMPPKTGLGLKLT